MSTIRVRRLDNNWDPVYGNGQNDYLFDGDAVVQIIQSRLRLWLGEWWENLDEGLPMFQRILGVKGASKSVVDSLIQKRISGTKYVTGIQSFESEFNVETREYQCLAKVYTAFGTVLVSTGGV